MNNLKNILKVAVFSVGVVVLGACGTNDQGSVQAVINNIQQEIKVSDVDCFYQAAAQGLVCVLSLRTSAIYNDVLTFEIRDPESIFFNFLNVPLPVIGSNLINVGMSYQSNGVNVTDGSISFSQITTVTGGRVCANFDLFGLLSGGVGQATFSGRFCGTVQN